MTTGPRASLADRVFEGLTGRTVMEEHFPMLLDAGIPDIGLTVHSHFLTFLVGVGQSMGFAAVAECPIWWARERGLGDVRADSVWFDKPDMNARLAFEFERFERGDESKLRGKVENLAIASNATEGLSLCVLVYWVRSGSTPRSMDAIIASYRDGFRRKGQNAGPARTPLMIVKCVMRPAAGSDRLVFGEFLRDVRNERLALGRA
ncbi:MAG: hypothetical protein AAGK22_29095 [Acidobacteriota bacterium]